MSGGLYLLCLVTVEKSVREKGAGVTTLYQRLGILVPILCSALLWGEVPSAVQLAGLAASVAVMAALWGGGGRAAAKGPLAVFLLGGAVESTGKVFQKCALAEYRPVFLFVLFAACAVLALPRLVRAPKLPPPRRGGAGRGDGGVQRPFLPFDDERPGNGAPPGVAYPVLSVGSVAAVTAVDVLVFHRALTRREKLGLALSAVCLVLVNL